MNRNSCIRAGRAFSGCLFFLAILVAPWSAARSQQAARAVTLGSQHALTPPLRALMGTRREKPNAPFHVLPLRHPVPVAGTGAGKPGGKPGTSWTDTDLTSPLSYTDLSLGSSFDGIGTDSVNVYVPPDPNLAVSPTQIVQTVNVEFAVWRHPVFGAAPEQTLAPEPIHAIFSSLSNSLCATNDGGDPIVLWDRFDQRWIISQLAYNSRLTDNHWCLAISTTSDATGSYSVYDFNFNSNFPDYPKLGIWYAGATSPYSGLYMSFNMFQRGSRFVGAQACAIPITSVQSPPAVLNLTCMQGSTSVYSILPADVDGSNAAPATQPEMYLQFNASRGSGNALALYQFAPNFQAPANSTWQLAKSINVATYHEACGGAACVPQPDTSQQLDSLGDRLMYRLAYRNRSNGVDTLLVNHSVQVSSSSNQTGVRWYLIDNPSGSTTVSEGTYAPADGIYRWMGSVAEDKFGDLGLGYSFSGPTTFPGVAVTGRTAGDTPASALYEETLVWSGAGSQTGVNRWGDYTSMTLDPSDDCTFWYTDEYLPATGSFNWQTRIASFRFPNCTN